MESDGGVGPFGVASCCSGAGGGAGGEAPGAAAGASSGAADGALAHVTMLGCWVASTLGCMPCCACGQLGSCGSVEAGAKAIGDGVGWYEAAVGGDWPI